MKIGQDFFDTWYRIRSLLGCQTGHVNCVVGLIEVAKFSLRLHVAYTTACLSLKLGIHRISGNGACPDHGTIYKMVTHVASSLMKLCHFREYSSCDCSRLIKCLKQIK